MPFIVHLGDIKSCYLSKNLFMECCSHHPHSAEKEMGSRSPGSAKI